MAQAGYTPIQLYYSSTASAAPSSGNLANGELAINITDGRLFYKDNGGTVRVLAGTNGTGVVAGSNTQVQFNNNGVFGASSGLTWDGTTLSTTGFTASNTVTLSGGTANGVAYLNGSKVLTTGSALTFDGTNLGIGTSSPGAKLDVNGAAKVNFSTYTPPGSADLAIGTNGILHISQFSAAAGTGGQIRIASTQNGYFASIRGYLTDGSNNTSGNLIIATRAASTDASLTDRLTIDNLGNLGLGVTPSAWSGLKAIQVGQGAAFSGGSSFSDAFVSSNAYYNGANWVRLGTNAAAMYAVGALGTHVWNVAGSSTAGSTISFTQAMTLDASGNLAIGTTVAPAVSNTVGSYIYGAGQAQFFCSIDPALILNLLGGTDGPIAVFRRASSVVGTIAVTGSATAYNTSSDYRLKENVQPMTGALARVAALKPVTYKWKADGSDGEGFIAHELAEVAPQCVTGEKDAVDAEGKPVYQGIDTSFLVATLTAAIQEQQAIIEQLKADVAALKGAA